MKNGSISFEEQIPGEIRSLLDSKNSITNALVLEMFIKNSILREHRKKQKKLFSILKIR
jgi:hypothetical protein